MFEYTYKATDPSGKIVKGVIEASEKKAAISRLQNMGYIPIRIALAGREGGRLNFLLSMSISSIFQGVSTKDVVIFTQDLSALLEAGLPVDRALHILIDVVEKAKFKEILKDILKTVQGGSYLSDA